MPCCGYVGVSLLHDGRLPLVWPRLLPPAFALLFLFLSSFCFRFFLSSAPLLTHTHTLSHTDTHTHTLARTERERHTTHTHRHTHTCSDRERDTAHTHTHT